MSMFECSAPGCVKSFQTFSELESHLDVGDHCVKDERPSETLMISFIKIGQTDLLHQSTSLKMNRLNLISTKVKMSQYPRCTLSLWAGPYTGHEQDPLD